MYLLQDMSPLLIPIIALLIPIVGVVAWAVVKVNQAHLLHETVRILSANGQPIPPELLRKITGSKD